MECASNFMTQVPEHEQALRTLHEELNQGRDAQPEIDRYLLACAAELGGLRAHGAIRALVLQGPPVSVHDCIDIGLYVRQALVRQGLIGSAGMQKLVHYSIPFVKHNRLTFPPLDEFSGADMVAMLQVLLVACMGLVPGATRRPTFRVRVLLVHAVHALITRGSPQDQHAFLARSAQVMRACLTEYMLYFVVEYMPTEMQLLLELHHISGGIYVLQHMRACMDAFRTHALQTATLDWDAVVSMAQVCNDKCNRVCKGKNRTSTSMLGAQRSSGLDADTVRVAMALCPRMHVLLLKHQNPSLSYTALLQAQTVHAAVRVFAMPRNMRREQLLRMRAMLSSDTRAAVQSTMLQLCLGCLSARHVGDTNMRLDAQGNVGCNRCNTCSCVVSISMLGRLLRVDGQFFAYCPQCCCTHQWLCERGLYCTQRTDNREERALARECQYCTRTLNLAHIVALDDVLGVMHNVVLCRRHMPWQHRLPFVNTLTHLAYEVSNKYTVLNPYTNKASL